MKKRIKYLIFIGILLIFTALTVYAWTSSLWDIMFNNSRYEFKVKNNFSNKKSATLLSYTKNYWFDYQTYTYLIPGKYTRHKIPKDGNFIISDTSLDFKWKNDDTIIIYTPREPLADKFNFDGVKIEWVIGGVLYREFEDQKNISH